MTIDITLSVSVDIINPDLLRPYALALARKHGRGPSDLDNLGDYAAEAMIRSCPGPATEYIGFDMDAMTTHPLPLRPPVGRCIFRAVESWRIDVLTVVWDPERLRRYASSRYLTCWNHHLTFVNNTEQAVYEALIGSSEGPPSVDYGVRIVHMCYRRTPTSH